MVAGCGVPVRRNRGLKWPPKPRTASSEARLWLCPSDPQPHVGGATCRQVIHKHRLFLEVEEFTPAAAAPPDKYPNDPSDADRRQMRKSQRGGAAGGCAQHCKHTSALSESKCADMRLLIDWYFHYGCRVVWRMLICLGVLQVCDDCSGARRKGELMKVTEPNHNLWVKINWLIRI